MGAVRPPAAALGTPSKNRIAPELGPSERATKFSSNLKYSLSYFSAKAKKYQWRKQASSSSDLRIKLYLLFEEPGESRCAACVETFSVIIIIVMMLLTAARSHLPVNTHQDPVARQTADYIFAAMAVCNTFFTAEFCMRTIAVCAPVALVRDKRRLASQISWSRAVSLTRLHRHTTVYTVQYIP